MRTSIAQGPGPGLTSSVTPTSQGLLPISILGDGPGTVAHNREMASLAGTRQAATWTTADNITAVTITVVSEAAGTAQLVAAIGVCFDAPSDGVATTWLTGGPHLTDDSEMVIVPAYEPRTFYFPDALVRLDAIRLYGSQNLRVLVEAN